MFKKLGILGGMGPLATNYLYNKLITNVVAQKDQDHINMVILNDPQIPDRTEYILDNTRPNPLVPLIEGCLTLQNASCDIIAIPCNTSHFFFDDLIPKINTKIISLVDLTVDYLVKNNISNVCLLATEGTIISKVYEKEFLKNNINCTYLTEDEIKRIMTVIYSIKTNLATADISDFYSVVDKYQSLTQKVVLGCTELSLLDKKKYGDFLVDPLDLLTDFLIKAFNKQSVEESVYETF
jgi:aspartate racemase